MYPKTIKPIKVSNKKVDGHYDINLSGWFQYNRKWYYFHILEEDTFEGGSDVILYGVYEMPPQVMLAVKGLKRQLRERVQKGKLPSQPGLYFPFVIKNNNWGYEGLGKFVGYCKIYGSGYHGKTRPHRVQFKRTAIWGPKKHYGIRATSKRGHTKFKTRTKPLKTRAFTEIERENIIDALIDKYLGSDDPLLWHNEALARAVENHPQTFMMHAGKALI